MLNGMTISITPEPSPQLDSLDVKVETNYQQWLAMDMRKCELNHNIRKALLLVSGKFSYQRQKGLDQLLELISKITMNQQDVTIFSLLHRKLSPESNVILSIVNNILKGKSEAQHNLSPIRIQEVKKSLAVIEGACLLSPYCSSALATVQGGKIIVKILSECGAAFSQSETTSNPLLDSLSTPSATIVTQTSHNIDILWEEIRIMAIDTLEASLHNCISSAISFCEDSCPDMIIEMVRNKHLSQKLRSKCVEIVCLLFQLMCVAEKRRENETVLLKTLSERIEVFLGLNLTEELIETALKPIESRTAGVQISLEVVQLQDMTFYDQFVKRVDQRFL
ncbi:hypothetical protein AKO1_014691 [Acrasis kona]|uniref:Uncharacterized protein n=1 Tax=Acrasis kona TaxID=1008807 RepID=A0AAW2Z356_9EUKA